ncbi:MAG: CDP-archaeol synthase [Rhodovibrionaceae bacterium]|nr:CDP-archaeol synthase [Rhodovibrionaceae bacterium]
MDLLILVKMMALLTAANGTPVIAKRLLGQRFATPLDFGAVMPDGQRLFGQSKTLRGLALAVAATALLAWAIGYSASAGALFGGLSMLGDLTSSFIKRRLGKRSSSRAMLLDQIPESLFPLLALAGAFGLSALDITVTVGLFTLASIFGSRVLFRLGIRDRPY